MLSSQEFDKEPLDCAKFLLGKVLKVKHGSQWLSAIIIETEAYCLNDKASHASLGYTEKRAAVFMPPGVIYMYYSRGGDSLNVSCRGLGNAVLIKAGYPCPTNSKEAIQLMQRLNPRKNGTQPREISKLCSGQALLCKSLGLTVKKWDKKNFDLNNFFIESSIRTPKTIIQTKRLGIPKDRDTHHLYRFIDLEFIDFCTKNPLKIRRNKEGVDYIRLNE